MKIKAPWKDRTGNARRGLWAENEKSPSRLSMTLGHSVEYGVYLEESNGGKFQILMPTLVATARSFMQSLEHMFAQMETHTVVTPFISPGVGTRPGTSQGARERAFGAETRPSVSVGGIRHTVDKLGRASLRQAGRFISKVEAKRIDRNAARRERYAQRKAEGTLPTRRTKRG
jgi:hypothetical protein